MDTFLKELDQHLKTTLAKLTEELKSVRGNRPAVQMVENLPVVYYEELLTVKQLGTLSVKPPREIDVTVWDKNAVGPVQKAIQDANLGLSVSTDGNTIRLNLPTLTDERRTELNRVVKKMVEAARIQIRARRDETNKKIKAAEEEKKINEDQVFDAKEKIQKMTDEANKSVEDLLTRKLQEISE